MFAQKPASTLTPSYKLENQTITITQELGSGKVPAPPKPYPSKKRSSSTSFYISNKTFRIPYLIP